MKINNIFYNVINEQAILKTTRTKPIVDAIKNRQPVSFFYSGPRKPKKKSVKAGNRIKAEIVALGLSKKGNLIVRAFVQPPSVSKRGFAKHGWRTFMVTRMNNIKIHDDESFTIKRDRYKEGDDGSMTVTYVTTDWTKQPKIKKPKEKPAPQITTKKPEPVTKTEPKPEEKPKGISKEKEPTPEKLPQPKPEEKPKPITTEPEPQTTDTTPEELPQPKPEEKPEQNPEDENKNLQEIKKRFKSLIYY